MPRRGRITEVAPDRFRYEYYDVSEPDSHAAFLQSRGFQGGGETWGSIVYGLLKLRSTLVLRKVELDPEGDGLAVWSASRFALEAVADLVDDAKQDSTLILQALEAAAEDQVVE